MSWFKLISSFFDIVSELLRFNVFENGRSITLFWEKFFWGSTKSPKMTKNGKTVSKHVFLLLR